MDDIEKKHLALKFFSLSREDQKSILGQLPIHVRNELVNSISMLKDEDFNQNPHNNKKPYADQSIMLSHDRWNQFIIQVESALSERKLSIPSRFIKTIKDMSTKE